jgi:hypothetical protein
MKKVLEIRKSDIDKGVMGDRENCPIALALKRTFNNIDEIEVVSSHIVLKLSIPCTKKIEDFIDKFDENGAVKPTRILLDL